MGQETIMTKLLLALAAFFSFEVLNAQTLVHYWNFNLFDTEINHLSPSYTAGGAGISYVAGGANINDFTNGTGQNFNLLNVNARNGDASGNHLRINNPIGAALIFSLPTTGFSDVVFKYATRRSGSGAGSQIISYTLDGTSYQSLTTINPVDGNPTLQTLDFSGIAASDNNPLFKIKIEFALGSGGTVGNNRFDNITLEGSSSGTDVIPPSATIIPPNGSVSVSVNAIPTITFNEPVRINYNNTAINDTNVDYQVIFRLNNVSGASVPFDATYSGNTITITPSTPLASNQQYYLSLTDSLEDLSDNPLNPIPVSQFTTIAAQTAFNPGDLLFIGYQMNAVPNEDRIAFVTLVDILPATQIVFTDAKYTTNTPAQCPGGFTWTAPATGVTSGNVIIINNDAGTANIGTVTGSTFGLSANGDQVIVYTSTGGSPQFITALSSNAWVPSNTVCNGSFSALPAALTDGVNSINLSTAPGNTAGNTVNAYYNGPTTGSTAALKAAITNPSNWIGTASATPAQTWPAWAFPGAPVVTNSTITFNMSTVSVAESAGQLNVQLNITNPTSSNVKLVVKGSPTSTAGNTDFTLSTQTLNIGADSSATRIITIPIIDDSENEQDEYFTLTLEDASGVTVTGNKSITVYIRDNERTAPVPNKQIELSYIGSYDPSGSANASSEIVVFDSATKRLFIISALQNRLDIADFSNPSSMQPITSIDMTPYGGITSVAVRNGIVAASAPNANQQLNGSVVIFNTDGVFQKQVTVGALPDMITFTPDGKKIMTANEGQPNDSYTVDPEGSVSIIDITGGIGSLTQGNVTTLDFTSFNAQTAALVAAGVRKGFPGSTLSQDLEPEYIAFSTTGDTAWVILQEANAFAVVNLKTNTVADIWSLGKKDHSLPGNGFDASDVGTNAHIANWPVKGIYMPDGIATYQVNGTTYIVGANEGDDREYSAFNERLRVNSPSYVLDSATFPHAEILKKDYNLGRLRVTRASGDTDGDGDFDEINLIGGRSFSIWNTATKSVVYDSKDDFEQYLSKTPQFAAIFNADHESNTPRSRSTSKGPEPEGLALASIAGKQYAFIGLERQGGVMVYDITNPASVNFVDYKNPRNLNTYGGDNGPEGIIYVPGSQSPDSNHYIIVANEISGTLSIYKITGEVSGTNKAPLVSITNPVAGTIYKAGARITLEAQATDTDGTISKVEFYNGASKFAEDSTAPYQYTEPAVAPGTYVLVAKATDNNGAEGFSDTLRLTIDSCTGSGTINAEGYTNIQGAQVVDLVTNAAYPSNPSVIASLNSFEYGNDLGDNYGARVRGYICAPQTGYYTFYIAGDDQAGLLLSTNDDPDNRVRIAYVESHVAPRAWFAKPAQKSVPVHLVKGVRYYIEALHKEFVGSDHLSVAWVLPDGTFEGPIPGARLSPWDYPSNTRISNQGFNAALENALIQNGNGALLIKATPNPSPNYFNVKTTSASTQPVSIFVTDVQGRLIEKRISIPANGTIQLGNAYRPGLYFVEIIQNGERKRVKLVKQ